MMDRHLNLGRVCSTMGRFGLHGGVDFEASRIYNVSRLDENYEIAYEPTWVEV